MEEAGEADVKEEDEEARKQRKKEKKEKKEKKRREKEAMAEEQVVGLENSALGDITNLAPN